MYVSNLNHSKTLADHHSPNLPLLEKSLKYTLTI